MYICIPCISVGPMHHHLPFTYMCVLSNCHQDSWFSLSCTRFATKMVLNKACVYETVVLLSERGSRSKLRVVSKTLHDRGEAVMHLLDQLERRDQNDEVPHRSLEWSAYHRARFWCPWTGDRMITESGSLSEEMKEHFRAVWRTTSQLRS